jgi:hypothetical protein
MDFFLAARPTLMASSHIGQERSNRNSIGGGEANLWMTDFLASTADSSQNHIWVATHIRRSRTRDLEE